MTEELQERRLSARIKGSFKITITHKNDTIVVNTIDLSSSGLRFKSTKNIPLFREISLSLTLPVKKTKKRDNVFKCNAIVVRSEKSHFGDGYNVALAFVDIDKEYLISFLEKVTKQQSK